MKIFSSPYVKAALVAVGLLAVLLAYRPEPTNSGSGKVALQTASGKTIKLRSQRELAQTIMDSPASEGAYPATGYSEIGIGIDANQPVPALVLPLESVEPGRVDDGNLDLEPIASSQASDEQAPWESQIETEFAKPAKATTVDYVESRSVVTPMPSVSPALNEVAAQKAVHHIEYGKSLARRNATEAAGQEFLGAIRVLAESNDQATGGNAHMSALRSGLRAIKEATDFKTDDPNRQISMNIANVIEGHDTQIISREEARTMGASTAMRRYFEFAGQQLGRCGGQNAVAAEALYCLGKMKTITAQWNPDPESAELYESIIYHHASLAADATNFRSANELGVLLARNGHLEAAETYLKNSLTISPTPQGWANLAKVHQRKGTQQDQQLANLAIQEYQIALSRPVTATGQAPIQWVQPQEFIARSPVQHPSETETVQVQSKVVPVINEQPESENPSIAQRIGSLFWPKNAQR